MNKEREKMKPTIKLSPELLKKIDQVYDSASSIFNTGVIAAIPENELQKMRIRVVEKEFQPQNSIFRGGFKP